MSARRRAYWTFLIALAVLTFSVAQAIQLALALRQGEVSLAQWSIGVASLPLALASAVVVLRLLYVGARPIGRDERVVMGTVAGLGVALTLLISAVPVFAHGEEVTVDPPEAQHGQAVRIEGTGFEAGQELTITLEGPRGSVLLGAAAAGPDGAFSVHHAIPEAAAPGTYQLKVSGAEDAVTLDFAVLEEEGFRTPSGSTDVVFQRSPGETIAIAAIALALVAAGTTLVRSGRGRREAAQTS